MKDKPSPSYKYFAHKWVRSQTTRGYISPYAKPAYPALRRYKSMVEPSLLAVSSTSPPLPNNPRTRSYLSSLIPNPHQYNSPYNQPTMSPPSRTQRAKRTRKNGPGKFNKSAVLPPPISPPSPPPPLHPNNPKTPLLTNLYSQRPHPSCPPPPSQRLPHPLPPKSSRKSPPSNLELRARSPSPITFRIDQESRSATINHYSVHPHFYILGTQNKNKDERIHYPFFDPSVDSVVLNDISLGSNPALNSSSGVLGFYNSNTRELIYGKREVLDYGHFGVLQALHVPARTWDWNRIQRAPRTEIRFRNLTEIVLEGGAMGLRTKKDVKKCKEFIRGCFERSVEEIGDMGRMELASHEMVRNARTANMEIKVPEVRVIMPNGLDHEWMFEEDKLGMESIEERMWVMNFISKVKAGR
ncbi:uncharacterized protein Bfra_007071 [Botrytis fragariae]|uniref:Uncharacterized protein n=1 Tax=Botrytis fragariae TaxID=1964551 RepID=A0A8H6AIE5_9HELO|nr:uncharacterized protein Bfra_007071 [Botrytis fragariae]KAF5867876.1 hypothetical protein Bfra_007071 [Botrytis fragariae]